MKQLKYIGVILLLLVFINKVEYCKYPSGQILSQSMSEVTCPKKHFVSCSSFVCAKEKNTHFTVKKIKHRATASEHCTLRIPYLTKLVDFKIFKNRLIYGIAEIYQIRRHAYLHLYQLF